MVSTVWPGVNTKRTDSEAEITLRCIHRPEGEEDSSLTDWEFTGVFHTEGAWEIQSSLQDLIDGHFETRVMRMQEALEDYVCEEKSPFGMDRDELADVYRISREITLLSPLHELSPAQAQYTQEAIRRLALMMKAVRSIEDGQN